LRRRLAVRLGGHFFSANNIVELDELCEKADIYGFSAILPPNGFENWSDEDCIKYGEKARALGFVIGEAGYWKNLLEPDEEERKGRIEYVRSILRKADLMRINCVVTLVGSKDSLNGPLSPHPENFGESAKMEYKDICLRIVDGLELKHTKYATEPWPNNFYYEPEEILAFLKSVNHPNVGFHLDQTNLVSQSTYYKTTQLINKTFDLLSRYIVSVHAKDIRWDPKHMFLKFDEVYPGDGVLDYDTFLRRLSKLGPDMTVYCEHLSTEGDYAIAFARIHYLARRAGLEFIKRSSR
jgi:sugar phosphate isomerase/epimerase